MFLEIVAAKARDLSGGLPSRSGTIGETSLKLSTLYHFFTHSLQKGYTTGAQ
jgi:hypothetical protein